MQNINKTYILLLLSTTLCVFAYWPSLSIPLYLDDTNVLAAVNALSYPHNLFVALQSRVISSLSFYIPPQQLTNLASLHAMNIVIHCVNAYLLYVFCRALKVTPILALSAAVVWLVHPLNTQAVVYLSQRSVLVCTTFSLLCFIYSMRFWCVNKTHCKVLYAIVALICMVIAIFSKQSAVYLPLAAVILCYTQHKFKIKHGLFLVCLLLVTIGGLYFSPAILSELDSLTRETLNYSRLDYFATQQHVLLQYLTLFFVPLQLALEKPITVISFASNSFYKYAAINLAILAAVGLFALKFKDKRIIPLLVTFLLSVSVESGLIPIEDLYFEHRVYLPSMMVLIIIACMLQNLSNRFSFNNYFGYGLVACIVITFTYLTHERASLWSDKRAFYENEQKINPKSPRVLGELALIKREQGKLKEALVLAQKSFEYGYEQKKVTVTRTANLMSLMIENKQYMETVRLGQLLIPRHRNSPRLLSVIYSRVARAQLLMGNCSFASGWSTKALSYDAKNQFAIDTLNANCQKNEL